MARKKQKTETDRWDLPKLNKEWELPDWNIPEMSNWIVPDWPDWDIPEMSNWNIPDWPDWIVPDWPDE